MVRIVTRVTISRTNSTSLAVYLAHCVVSLIETVNIRAALLFITMNITT